MKDGILDPASEKFAQRPTLRDDRIALVSGSFDPVTVGHEALIAEASRLYAEVYVTVFVNADKKTMFTLEQRKQFLKAVCANYPNTSADSYDGYLSDYCREKGIEVVVKSYRNSEDYRYESLQAFVNHGRNPRLRTLLLPSSELSTRNAEVSSTAVREALAAGKSVDALLPPACRISVLQAYAKRKK